MILKIQPTKTAPFWTQPSPPSPPSLHPSPHSTYSATTPTTTTVPPQTLKSRLNNGESLYGLFLLSFSPTLAEIMCLVESEDGVKKTEEIAAVDRGGLHSNEDVGSECEHGVLVGSGEQEGEGGDEGGEKAESKIGTKAKAAMVVVGLSYLALLCHMTVLRMGMGRCC
ncbi:unnamed protein product [Ilex paraguariensis]|uniref:Uncharacterized protein n=1 Tax=Ilex paraguariensis TaxID=185542 RepID=A0ABC8TGY9_9AQUA